MEQAAALTGSRLLILGEGEIALLRKWLHLARMGLWFGSTVFGGAAAAYPVIKRYATETAGMPAEEVDGLYALSVFLPGPSFLNYWGAICWRIGGFVGALLGEVALLLPAFTLVLLLPLAARLPFVGERGSGILQGAVWGTVGLLAAMAMENSRKLKEPAMIGLVVGGLAALFLGMHPLAVMGLVLLLGGMLGYKTPVRKGGRAA